VDLPKQAKEQIAKLDGPGGAAKVRILIVWAEVGITADEESGGGTCENIGANEVCPARNSRYIVPSTAVFSVWTFLMRFVTRNRK
jgi:hypothetical protein